MHFYVTIAIMTAEIGLEQCPTACGLQGFEASLGSCEVGENK